MKPFASAAAAEPAGAPEADGAEFGDPTNLDLEQLMNLPLRGAAPRQSPDDILQTRERGVVGDGVPRAADTLVDLPADLTALSLGELLNLRVRAGPLEEEKEKDKKSDDAAGDEPDNGEAIPAAQQLAAAAEAAAAAVAAADGEAAQGENGDGSGGEGDGGDSAPPLSGGGSGSDGEAAERGQALQILPTAATFVSAPLAAVADSAPAAQPVVLTQLAERAAVKLGPPPNAAPIVQDDAAATAAQTAVTFSVLGNDRDPDGAVLHVTAVSQGANGKVAINPDGTLSYAPKLGFSGIDTFTYTVSDGNGGSSTARVTVTVAPPSNTPPFAVADTAQTNHGQPVTIAVLGNDGDLDGDPLTVTAATQGANGKVAINPDGTLTYVPAAGFSGTDTITYTVSDGRGGSASATVAIVVQPPNAPPTAGGGLASVEAGTTVTGTLAASDPDNSMAELHFGLAAPPTHGTAVVAADGAYSYVPAAGFVGTDRFSFSVTDPAGASSTASVTVTVLAKAIDTSTGAEIAVNTTTQGLQQTPAMAAMVDGGFVVVWESHGQDGSGAGVFAQRFDGGGNAHGGEFRVNTVVANDQQAPAVATLADGGFVVVWESRAQDGSNFGVFGQRFDSAGGSIGPEFRVNSFVQSAQSAPDIAPLAGGGFIVVWESQSQDGSNLGVFGQRYDAGGQPVGGEFQVNSTTLRAQHSADVAATADGGFVVVWQSQLQDGSGFGVYGQRFSAAGQSLGPEFQVNSNTGGDQQLPAVAALAGGGFVVVWDSQGQDGSNFGVYGQRFDAAGSPQGSEFRVNTFTQRAQQDASVVATSDGGFVVVWESDSQDGANFGVFAQRFDGNGSPVGPEFQVNTTTAQHQGAPDAVVLNDGSLAIGWASAGQDGSNFGVFGRIFDASAPVARTLVGGPGNDTLQGGALADSLSGGAGNDRLDGGPGADQLIGGLGDDVLSWDPADTLVDGGGGLDTLVAAGGDIDITASAGVLRGIEAIDLASDAGANRLTLRVQDVLDVSDTDILRVLGTAADSVNAGTGWSYAGADALGNNIYTQGIAGAVATLIIDRDVTVNSDILL